MSENFAAGVLDRWGFDYEALKAIRPDIIYVSNCGFGHSGPYRDYKTWGPIVQAISGLTFSSGLPDQPPAGWGYSYMDHTGGYFMAIAILMALHHRNVTGEGQWVDLACTRSGLHAQRPGPARRHRERPAVAPRGDAPRQSQPVPADGAAQHLRG